MERKQTKTCCGGGGHIFILDVPINKRSILVFQDSGYRTSDVYTRVGVFFVEKGGVTASGPFGGTKIQVRCGSSKNCPQILDELEETFRIAAEVPPQEPKQ
jgi:hypothetical protein